LPEIPQASDGSKNVTDVSGVSRHLCERNRPELAGTPFETVRGLRPRIPRFARDRRRWL